MVSPLATVNYTANGQQVEWGSFAINFNYQADLFGTYDMPAFWYNRLGKDWFVFAPNVALELSASAELAIQFWFFEYVFQLELIGYKLTPFELQYSFDLEGEGSRCSSWSGY